MITSAAVLAEVICPRINDAALRRTLSRLRVEPIIPDLAQSTAALTRRAALGLGRTGTSGGHFSGDIFLAFSTANNGALNSTFPQGEPTENEYDNLRFVPWGQTDPFYEAAVQCVEEAVLNALVANEPMTGRRGHRTPALPHDRARGLSGGEVAGRGGLGRPPSPPFRLRTGAGTVPHRQRCSVSRPGR